MVNFQNNRNELRSPPSHPRRESQRGSSRGEGNKICVSNIDFNCSHEDLKELFKPVADVAFVEMMKDSNQKPNGCAIIRFKENNVAGDAIRKMHRVEFKGRKLVVKDEREMNRDNSRGPGPMPKDRKRPRDDDHFDRGGPMHSLDKFGNTYGLSIQFLESLGIDGPLVNRVFVANLDYSVDEEVLKEVFDLAGKVTDIELVHGDDGKSKGFGFIELEHPVEAVQAISMFHNQLFHERPMSVQITRKEKKRKDGVLRLPTGLKGLGLGLGINGAPLKDVARTIEAGNQSSLLGAMPTGSGGGGMPVGMDMGGLGHGMNPAMGMSLGGSLGGGVGNVMGSGMASDLNSRGGMGLMERPAGLPLNVGLGSAMQNPIRSLADNQMASSSFSNYGSAALSSQRTSIQISNLSSDCNWKSVQNLCMPFGDVAFAKMTSRGVSIVQFDNEASARRAVDMLDHQRFEGRYLETRLV